MKTFRTVGSGSTQTIEPIENNKIPVYETKTAAETDLANLEVGQIIATKDTGSELSNPVDVVQDGNMHAVTSNAVYDSINELQPVDSVSSGNMKSVTSNAVAASINELQPVNSVSSGNMKSVTSNAVYDSINGLKPVNVIEGGNMSAVTSNAVFNYLNDVEVITPKLNPDSYAEKVNIKITRLGHLVNLNFSFVMTGNSGFSYYVASGLPTPIAIKDSQDKFYIMRSMGDRNGDDRNGECSISIHRDNDYGTVLDAHVRIPPQGDSVVYSYSIFYII